MTYAEIEDAALTLLAPLKADHGVRTLESYGGEFSPDSFGQVTVNYPAVYVCIPSLDSEKANQDDKRHAIVEVYAASRNLRGEAAARRGDSQNSGAYALIEAARAKLNRQTLPGAGQLILKRERLVGYSKVLSLCVMKAEFELSFRSN
ncbi:MAG: phage protein Gp37 [Pedobacter sp.]